MSNKKKVLFTRMPSTVTPLERLVLNIRWPLAGLSLMAAVLSGGLSDPTTLITLAVTLAYLLALEALVRMKRIAYLLPLISTGGDLLLITWAVLSFDRSFAALYYVVIVANALRYRMRKSLLGAVVVSFLYGGGTLWGFAQGRQGVIFRPLLQVAAFFVVAYLVGRLAESRERARWQLTRLREEGKRKSELLSTLSHELHTPLTMIKGAVDLLLEGRPGPMNGAQVTFLQTISQNCERLIRLVEELLAQARAEAGWVEIRPELIDVREPVKKTIRDIHPLVAQKRQGIRLDYPQVLPRVMADEAWIQQVMTNLICNASKYTSEGGNIFVSVIENQQCVLVSVTDDGAGMSQAERERLFEPFFRGDHTQRGTGLGLTIIKHIIEMHGGKVYVDTTLGRGTTFLFTLPKEVRDEKVEGAGG